MLAKIPFYHGITKRMVIAFAGIFSNVFCVTKDVNGVTQKIVNVPIALANKEKFIVRLQQDPNLSNDIEILLPRLSFEIIGFDYDSTRQLNKTNKVMSEKNGKSVHQYSSVPYNLTINMYSYTRTQEDNYQIMEQIVPYFTPDLNLSVKMIQNPDIIQDCQLILNDFSVNDTYDGGFEDRRYIITTYAFTLKMSYYGPFVGINDPENHFDGGAANSVIKKVIVNLNSNKYTAVVDPFDANIGDPHNIVSGWGDRAGPNDFDTNVTLP
jgi:T4-like virus Myoviridae tail sheath stabiliser